MRPNTTEVRFKDEYLATAILRWRLRARSGKAAQREAWSCIEAWDEASEYKSIVSVEPLAKTRLVARGERAVRPGKPGRPRKKKGSPR